MKIRPILFLVLTLSLLISIGFAPANAQIDTTENIPGTTVGSDFYNNTYFSLGMHLSFLSGIGISGRASFPKGFAVQLTTVGFSAGGRTFFNVGGEGQYAFTQGDGGRLYTFLGSGYYFTTSDDSTKDGNSYPSPVRLGAGFGYEWFASRNLTFDVAVPFMWFIGEGKVVPIPSVGFNYYFR